MPRPKSRSPSQCPGTARSAASAGRWEMFSVFGRSPRPSGSRAPAGRRVARLRAQVAGQLVPQVAAGLHEQRPVDRLVRHVHHCPGREPPPQPPGDLLRRPAQLQLVLDHRPQPRPPGQLRLLRPARPGPRGPIGGQRPIAAAGRRCRRPPATPSTAPDPARPAIARSDNPAARPREISSRSASDSRSSHRHRAAGRIPPLRLIRSRTVDGLRRISRASTLTACPDRQRRQTSSTSAGDNAVRTIGHHPIPPPTAKIMKIVSVRAAPSSSRRSASSRSATVRSSRPDLAAATGCAARPRRPSGRRWRRSCGPARSRTPAPAPTASPARPRTVSPSATSRCARCRPDPLAALDRPQPLRELPARRQQQPVALAVGAEPARHQRLLGLVEHLDRRGPLVRVHPDHDPAHQHAPSPSSEPAIDGGGQRYLELVRPLWSHSSSRCPARRTPELSHTNPRWAADVRATPPDTSTPAWPDRNRASSLR